jgi:carboxypeptidase family protein
MANEFRDPSVVKSAKLCLGPTAVVLLCAMACFRYETHLRPVRPDECPPEPLSQAYSRVNADPHTRGVLRGVLRGWIRSAFASAAPASPVDSLLPPLPDARVVLKGAGRSTSSDSLGYFRIDSLSPGRYAARVFRIGYRARVDTVVVADTSGATWDVALEQEVLDGCPGFMSIVERTRVRRWP